jgi:hypothetical protein
MANGDLGTPNYAVFSVAGSSITIDNSALGVSNFSGTIVDASTITVAFDNNKTFTGKLETPNRIRFLFPNGDAFWTKVTNSEIQTAGYLDGYWRGVGPKMAHISVSGTLITIDMSAFGRPDAHGSVLYSSTIEVTFPDDQTYTGRLELQPYPRKIYWSNGTVWNWVVIEG